MKLGRFPAVHHAAYAEGRSYQARWEEWRGGPHQPLKVTAVLAKPFVPGQAGALHLDGLLTAALMGSPLVGGSLYDRDRDGGIVIPLPLELTWVCPRGWPLWCATDLRPRVVVPAELYLHKRHPTDRAPLATRLAANTSAGRYKDVRMPVATHLADRLSAWCYGLPEPIEQLLDGLSHIGRKGAIGAGRVVRWSVERAPEATRDWIMERRPVPVAALAVAPAADRLGPLDPWTPPYWMQPRWSAVRRPSWTS